MARAGSFTANKKSMKLRNSLLLAGFSAVLGASTAHGATMIGWHYDGNGDDTLASGDSAGVVAQTNWNNHAGIGQGPGTVPFALNFEDGSASGASVTAWSLSSNNSWNHGYDSPNANEKLMGSFADQNPSITISFLPEDFVTNGYYVIVYYGNNEGPSTSTINLVGSDDDLASRTIITGNTAGAGYRANGFVEETGDLAGPTNYTVFTGLNDSEFTISFDGPNNNGISAIQIIQVPEPTSLGLAGVGVLAGLMKRRRKH
jgi:hypothetical protein